MFNMYTLTHTLKKKWTKFSLNHDDWIKGKKLTEILNRNIYRISIEIWKEKKENLKITNYT